MISITTMNTTVLLIPLYYYYFHTTDDETTVKQRLNTCQHHSAQYQFSSVTQLCLTLCDSMNHSTPGLPVHHQLPEFTQTHVH